MENKYYAPVTCEYSRELTPEELERERKYCEEYVEQENKIIEYS